VDEAEQYYPIHLISVGMLLLKMATPTKVDSKLTDAQLESRKRATKALEGDLESRGKATKARRLE
jgi:hypothetical protein